MFGLLNLVGAFYTAIFFIGLYQKKIGPKKIEQYLSNLMPEFQFVISILLFQLALECYQYQLFFIPILSSLLTNLLYVVRWAFHEAGHVYWRIFGELMSVMGGTIHEVVLILFFAIFCFGKLYLRLAGFSLFILGYNLNYTSWYINDSVKMKTAEIGYGHGTHDWKYMLDYFDLFQYGHSISKIAYTLGQVSIFLGVLLFVFAAFSNSKIAEDIESI